MVQALHIVEGKEVNLAILVDRLVVVIPVGSEDKVANLPVLVDRLEVIPVGSEDKVANLAVLVDNLVVKTMGLVVEHQVGTLETKIMELVMEEEELLI